MATKTHALGDRRSAEVLTSEANAELLESRSVPVGVAPGPCGRKGTEPFGLTAREQDVLCLMARRRTDAEIADQLFISYRTVTTHVTRIIDKLGARNRRDAAATAASHGLTEMCA